ncbi:hypothetical protein H072_464 [Dactylellina haptotyla CBS 200.50]|uniref:F-box domain-containing protein n=1 Tax=Dactylellina haptotyla (strain CBS 200.50) TaxID=1284197 RepID=S8ARD4_DACHA|nr:hypothetical protein H072_464 [Dactylellina haptotyla CBS 200.50]
MEVPASSPAESEPSPQLPDSKTISSLAPEILELILLHIPAIELLTTCHAVCKKWKNIIETSEEVGFYATTGLRKSELKIYPRGTKNVDEIPRFATPMALEVLSRFWRKLARNCIDLKLEVGIHPHDETRSDNIGEYLIRASLAMFADLHRAIIYTFHDAPPITNRTHLNLYIKGLYAQFNSIVKRVPLLVPRVDAMCAFHALSSSNWAYIRCKRTNGLMAGHMEMVGIDMPPNWYETLYKLSAMTFYYSPRGVLEEEPQKPHGTPVCLEDTEKAKFSLKFHYLFGYGGEGDESIEFGSSPPYVVSFSEVSRVPPPNDFSEPAMMEDGGSPQKPRGIFAILSRYF